MRDIPLERATGPAIGLAVLIAILLFLASAADVRAGTPDPDLRPAGTVEVENAGSAFLVDGSEHCTLHVGGHRYRFTLKGIGMGHVGAAPLVVSGHVYNLRRVAFFPGSYRVLHKGYARTALKSGRLWLINGDGVVLELETPGDAVALAEYGDVEISSK